MPAPILVIGSAGIDLKGFPDRPLVPQASTPGRVLQTLGGVGRNMAENLARLGLPTRLVTALGDDEAGRLIRQQAESLGLDMSLSRICPGQRTGAYLSIQDHTGDLVLAISDHGISSQLDPDFLAGLAGPIAEATWILLDLNLSDESIHTILDLAEAAGRPVALDPTSPARAHRLRPFLHRLALITPNAYEAGYILDLASPPANSEQALVAAQNLLIAGPRQAVITLGATGLVYAEKGGPAGFLAAPPCPVIDSTGAGDALTAGLLYGLYQGQTLARAAAMGIKAAQITLASPQTVAPELKAAFLEVL
jgi:pseudouridine kinase